MSQGRNSIGRGSSVDEGGDSEMSRLLREGGAPEVVPREATGSDATEWRVGVLIDAHYEIIAKIGAGGMGEVYRCRDRSLDREVALKRLPAAVNNDPGRRARFEREARLAARINHPSVATIYGRGTHDGVPYVVMEYVAGTTLRELIKGGSLPRARALKIAGAIAEGLAAAHEQGVLHRDLKPDNVMLSETGVKLVDFGLARVERTEGRSLPGDDDDTELETRKDQVMGTPAYMSPEQAFGREVRPTTDVFSFGVCLYEMLTGVNPFKRSSGGATRQAVATEPPSLESLDRIGVPRAVIALVMRCIEKDPARRYPDARAVALSLREAVSSEAVPARMIVVGGVGVGVGVVAIAIKLLGSPHPALPTAPPSNSPHQTDPTSRNDRSRAELPLVGGDSSVAPLSPDATADTRAPTLPVMRHAPLERRPSSRHLVSTPSATFVREERVDASIVVTPSAPSSAQPEAPRVTATAVDERPAPPSWLRNVRERLDATTN